MTGFIESGYDERDHILGIPEDSSFELPETCDYTHAISTIKDQGNTMKCVPYSLSYALELMHKLNGEDIKVDIDAIYNRRENEGEGMMIRDALNQVCKIGYNDKKIMSYARLGSELVIKYSLLANGPCLMALPVRSGNDDFWNGSDYLGGHAICCVGYDKDGFILLNSWGKGFGFGGKCILPYDELNKIIECWAVIA